MVRSILVNDAAENSIMQTITVAVSAILIVAGLMTAPGLINNARNNNARTDLMIMAYAQDWAMSNTYRYYENVLPGQPESLFDQVNGVELATGISYTLSGGVTNHGALICENPWEYMLRATADSGVTFYIASGSRAVSSNPNDLDIAECITDNPDYADFIDN